jgi:hypothetical protein
MAQARKTVTRKHVAIERYCNLAGRMVWKFQTGVAGFGMGMDTNRRDVEHFNWIGDWLFNGQLGSTRNISINLYDMGMTL